MMLIHKTPVTPVWTTILKIWTTFNLYTNSLLNMFFIASLCDLLRYFEIRLRIWHPSTKEWRILRYVTARVQQQNRKLLFLASVTLFEKVLQLFLACRCNYSRFRQWFSILIKLCVSGQYACANDIFEKT